MSKDRIVFTLKLPKQIEVGGYILGIKQDEVTQRILNELCLKGAYDRKYRKIELSPNQTPTDFNNTCIHEFIEAVNDVWCNSKIRHSEITNLTNGLHQIFEQLGITFEKGEE